MHTHFGSDEEGEGSRRSDSHAQAGPSGVASPCAATGAFQCVSTVRTDFDQKDPCYVLQLAHSPAANLVAATLSNRRVKLFNASPGGMQFVGELTGHGGPITEAHFALPEEAPHLLHTCSADGSVRGWDTRSGQQVELYQAPRAELLACSTNGTLVVAGGGAAVLFWDRRTQRPAGSFSDTHAQEVTQVRFHPLHRNMLVSASEDGLLAVFDTAPQLDEDEGFKAALNIDTAAVQLGFYGQQGARLWVRSGTESLHLWEWAAACSEDAEGGCGALAEALDARQQLKHAAGATPVGAPLAPGLDYLIGCEWNAAANQLWALAGTSSGAVGFFPVLEGAAGEAGTAPASGSSTQLFGPPAAALIGGHSEVVRAVLWPGAAGGMCLSGGEDSNLCLWSTSLAAAAGQQEQQHRTSSGDGALRRHEKQHAKRMAPY